MEKRVFKSNFLKGAVCAALAALLCAALLTCSNAAGGSDAPSSQQSVSSSSRKPGYVTLTGTVSVSGAVPQILADTPDASDNSQNGLSRSAYPGIDASGADATMEYFATATCGSDVVNGTFGSGREAKKFGIELAASKTWSIVVGVRSKTAGDDGKKKVYLESPAWTVTPDPADPTISHNFVPVPIVTSAGKGTIELAVNYIHSVFDTSARFVSGPSGYDSLPIISSTEGNDQIYKVLNVPSGTYELCIDIMEIQGGNKFLVYSSIQTVSVADGMTTNAWVSDGSGIIDSNGTFKFDDSNATALKQSYLSSNIYVGKYSDESNSQIADASDTNSGNWMAPLASINQAVNRINSAGKSNIDYVVHLNGKIQSDDLNNTTRITASSVMATHAKSITIVGTTGPSKDILEATKQGTPALMVTTRVPIIIKNIKLDGYSGAGSSAALDASGGAKVTIESGVEIADADLGVRVADTGSDGTTVTMKGGTISGNVTAVDLQGGDFILQGGSIPYDTFISSTKKNDVKLASGKVIKVQGDLTAVTGDKIGVTPSERKRGVKVVDTSAATANAATVEGKFLIADPTITSTNPLGDEWQVVAAAAEHALKTNAPIYVGQDPNGYAGSNGNPGTKSAPYYEIQRACEDMDDADMPYTINVRGKLPKQIIPSTLSKESTGIYKAKSVLIKGVTPIPTSGENAGIPQDKIQVGLGGTVVKSALTVASKVPITIQNLKITGGEDTNGGGLYLNSETEVHLESGVLITDNTALNHGGGVYCAGGKLFINEGAKICGNHVSPSSGSYGGIGLYATGDSVIEMTGGEISGNKDTSHVDVVGGGVKLEGSASFKMSGGEVKDNQVVRLGGNFYVTGGGDSGPSVTLSGSAKITGGVADSSSTSYDAIGGAVWLEGAGSRLDMSGGEISGNSAKSSNGKNACAGIYVSGATFSMTGGKISGNNVLGGNIQGGAVRLNGKFNISGSAYIPYGGAVGNNDVYLCSEKTVTIAAALTPPEGVTKVAAITPSVFKRGTNILDGTADLLSQNKEKFSVSQDDSGWDRGDNISVASETAKKVWITSPIYVVDATDSGNTKPTGFNKGKTSGANGTKTSPYASIAAAALASDLAEADGKITVAGTLTGAQTISSVASGVSSVTLKGYDSNATINGNADGSALTINAAKTFTIQQLKITNGKAAAGGGINIESGSGTIVNLDSGAIVYSNKATDGGSGAGVYVASGATLNIKTGSEIYSNAAYSGTINGGGVYNGGTTTTSGGQIYNNSANNGGGVYNGGLLYVTGTSLIGDGTANNNTATGANPGSNCSNLANYGGGIYNNGNLYFGCDSNGSSSTTGYALTESYGVRRNNATQGGGIYLAGGTFKAASGTVSYNHAAYGGAIYVSGGVNNLGAVTLASNNVNNSGGALYLANSTSLTVSGAADFNANSVEITSGSNNPRGGAVYNSGTLEVTANATFKNNVAKVTGGTGSAYGGAIYNGGTLTMTAGTIGATSNLNSVSNTVSGSASKAYGGAIYQGGTFNVSGSAKVWPGTERSNDVYLLSGKVVTISGNYNGDGNTASSQMSLTPANWTRGSYVLGGASCNTTNAGYFKITDSEWEILKNNSTDKGRIDADIYVAPTSSTTTVNSVTYGKGAAATAGGLGTKAKPYSTIADAVAQCWGGPKDKGTGVSRTINIVGTISGAQEIASTVTTSKASGITLKGVNTSATLNGNMSSTSATKKSTLTISTAVPVTIQTLTVKGGYSSGNGGGILVNGVKGASLTLGENAKVTGNTASTNGGGIYFAGTNASGGTANLIMNSTSQISGNTANGTAATNGGGGVYLSYANLSMSGSALIGDTSGTTYATSASTGHSNMAKNGGGVYLAAGGKLRLGYASAGATGGTNLSSTYGIRHNYASACGGGVYAVGSVDFASGAVSCNGTAGTSDCDGGGIWFGSASTLTMTGGTIASNKGYYGGGVYAGGTLSMSGGTIGDSSKTTAATSSSGYYSNSASYGGGIYAPSGAKLTLNGGFISYNYAVNDGGGIDCMATGDNVFTFNANANYNGAKNGGGIICKTVAISGGTIKGNEASGGGGGFYSNGSVTMSGGTVTNNKVAASGNGGAAYLSGLSATLNFAGSATIVAGTSNKENTVYLYQGGKVGVVGNNLPTSATVATIIPDSYAETKTVMGSDSANACASKFAVWKNGSEAWFIASTGYLNKGARMNMSSMTANDIKNLIPTLASGSKIVITGSLTSTQWSGLEQGLMDLYTASNSNRVTLDLSGTSITSVPEGAFNTEPNSTGGCMALSSVILPSTCTTISEKAFYGCNNLTTISGIQNVTTLGKSCFGGCKLTNFTIPSGVKVIPDGAFWSCSSLGTIRIPSGVTSIGKEAFSCSYITGVTFEAPVKVTSIGESAFNYCRFGSFEIPSGVTVIEKATFYNCNNLISITIPSTVTKIYATAFHSFAPESQRLEYVTFQTSNGWKKNGTTAVDMSSPSANVAKLTVYNTDDYYSR